MVTFLLELEEFGFFGWIDAVTFLPAAERLIAPGEGILIDGAQDTDFTLLQIGQVRGNAHVQKFADGFQLVAEGFPVPYSPVQRGLADSGIVGNTGGLSPSSADQIHTWAGNEVAGADYFCSYHLLEYSGDGGLFSFWVNSTTHVPVDDEPLFIPDRNTHLRRVTEFDAPYRIDAR